MDPTSGHPPEPNKPSMWSTFISKTRPSQIFYYNHQTGESTWNVNQAKDYNRLKLQQQKIVRPSTPDGSPGESTCIPSNFDQTRPPPNFDPSYAMPNNLLPNFGTAVYNPNIIPAAMNLLQQNYSAARMFNNQMDFSHYQNSMAMPPLGYPVLGETAQWNMNMRPREYWGPLPASEVPHNSFEDFEINGVGSHSLPYADLRQKLKQKDMTRSYSEASSEPDESVQNTRQCEDQFRSRVSSNSRFANHKITIDEAKLLLEKDFSSTENPDYKDKELVIVLDTNMLMHNIQFISILRSAVCEANRQTRIVVPFRVMRELNNLKVENLLARQANNFLNVHLNKNFQFIGQSNFDAKQIVDELQSNDCEFADIHILNCCMQQAKRNHRVILLTNDVSFCNIASSNGIDALQYVQVVQLVLQCKKNAFNRAGRVRLRSPDLFSKRAVQEEEEEENNFPKGLTRSKSIPNLALNDTLEKLQDDSSSSATIRIRTQDDGLPIATVQNRMTFVDNQSNFACNTPRRRTISENFGQSDDQFSRIPQEQNCMKKECKTPRKRITYESNTGGDDNLAKTPKKVNLPTEIPIESSRLQKTKIVFGNDEMRPEIILPKTPHKRIVAGSDEIPETSKTTSKNVSHVNRNNTSPSNPFVQGPKFRVTFNNDRQESTVAKTVNPNVKKMNFPNIPDETSHHSNRVNLIKLNEPVTVKETSNVVRKKIVFDIDSKPNVEKPKIKLIRRSNQAESTNRLKADPNQVIANKSKSQTDGNSSDQYERQSPILSHYPNSVDSSFLNQKYVPITNSTPKQNTTENISDVRQKQPEATHSIFDFDEKLGFIVDPRIAQTVPAAVPNRSPDLSNENVTTRMQTIKNAIKDCLVNKSPSDINPSENESHPASVLNEDDADLQDLRKFMVTSSLQMHKLEWVWVIRQKMEDVLKCVLENHIESVTIDKRIPQPWSLNEILTQLEGVFPSQNSSNVGEIMLWNSIKQLNQVVKDRIEIERTNNKSLDLPKDIIESFYELSYKVAKRLKGIEQDGYTINKLLEVMNTICDLDKTVNANVLSNLPTSSNGITNFKGTRSWNPYNYKKNKEQATRTNDNIPKPSEAINKPTDQKAGTEQLVPQPTDAPPQSNDPQLGDKTTTEQKKTPTKKSELRIKKIAKPVFKLKHAGRPYQLEKPVKVKKLVKKKITLDFKGLKDLSIKRTIVNDYNAQKENIEDTEIVSAQIIDKRTNPNPNKSKGCSDIIEVPEELIKNNPNIKDVLTVIFKQLYMMLLMTKFKSGESVPVEDNSYETHSLEEIVTIYEKLSGSADCFYDITRALIFDEPVCRCMSKRFMKAVKVLITACNVDAAQFSFCDFLGHMLCDMYTTAGYANNFGVVKNVMKSYCTEYRKMEMKNEV